VRVCANLLPHFPDTKLVITGPLGPHNPANVDYFELLRSLQEELHLQNVVHFLAALTEEFVPDAVISDFYHLADALFMPSREEGFGIPILEAGLAGLPIFCSDIPPLRGLGSTNATYFSPDADPVELANRIVNHLSFDPIFRMRARVRRHFSWEGIYAHQIAPLLVK
jgi:glycosyltransferase involved in cell wall biosynthesis